VFLTSAAFLRTALLLMTAVLLIKVAARTSSAGAPLRRLQHDPHSSGCSLTHAIGAVRTAGRVKHDLQA